MGLVVQLVRQVGQHLGQAGRAGEPDLAGEQRHQGDHTEGRVALPDVAEQVLVVRAVRAHPTMAQSRKVRIERCRRQQLPASDDQAERG
jgi:hypothetical protein